MRTFPRLCYDFVSRKNHLTFFLSSSVYSTRSNSHFNYLANFAREVTKECTRNGHKAQPSQAKSAKTSFHCIHCKTQHDIFPCLNRVKQLWCRSQQQQQLFYQPYCWYHRRNEMLQCRSNSFLHYYTVDRVNYERLLEDARNASRGRQC